MSSTWLLRCQDHRSIRVSGLASMLMILSARVQVMPLQFFATKLKWTILGHTRNRVEDISKRVFQNAGLMIFQILYTDYEVNQYV